MSPGKVVIIEMLDILEDDMMMGSKVVFTAKKTGWSWIDMKRAVELDSKFCVEHDLWKERRMFHYSWVRRVCPACEEEKQGQRPIHQSLQDIGEELHNESPTCPRQST